MLDSVNGSTILKAGDYKLETLSVRSFVNNKEISIRELMTGMEIYEDLFSYFLTAKIYIVDGLNLPEILPIRGQEVVKISFKTDVDALPLVELNMRVYKLDSHKVEQSGKAQRYVLHLISEGGYQNRTKICGYGLQGTSSNMVQSIFKKHFDSSVWQNRLDVEPTKDRYSFVFPKSMTPMQAVSWLTNRAKSTSGNDFSPFMFFETLDGHSFRSLSSIIQNKSRTITKYYYNTGNLFVGDGVAAQTPADTGPTPLPARYHKLQDMEELSRFDMVDNFMNGKVSSSLMVHDLISKEVRTTNLYENQVFTDAPKIGDNLHFLLTDPLAKTVYKTPAVVDYLPSTSFTVWNQASNIVNNTNHESLFLKRKYHMNSLISGHRVSILVFGDSRRRVGDLVELYIPKMSADARSHEQKEDKNLSGVYMVTALKHTIGTAYTCKMELSKTHLGV